MKGRERRVLSKRLGWHILPPNGCLLDGRYVRKGRWYGYMVPCYDFSAYHTPSETDQPALCYQGMHAGYGILDAIRYKMPALGRRPRRLCRVAVEGISVRGTDTDKFVGTRRKVLWSVSLTLDDKKRLSALAAHRYWSYDKTAKTDCLESRAVRLVNKLRKEQEGGV